MPIRRTLIFVPLFFAAPSLAAPPCAQTVRELRTLLGDPGFPLQWRETSMDDGKPLVMSILERDGALFLSFVKSHEGLWAEGEGAICTEGKRIEARFSPGKMIAGPAAHWAMRYSLRHGAHFSITRLDVQRIRISTAGWSGTFAAPAPD